MSVPVPTSDLLRPRAGDTHNLLDPEIVATIPIRVPFHTTPHSTTPEAAASESSPPVTPLTDAELLSAFVQRRDADAFTEIVQRYRQMVYRVALRAVEDRHLADDVFQATFLVLSQSASKIKSGEVLAAWLHGTARNLARRALSHQHTERQRLTQLATQTLAEKGGEMTTSTAVDPFDELVRCHEQQILDEELQQLPEASRAPLVLFYLEQKSQAEIAQMMGLTVEAIEGRLKRAKQELRARLIRRGVLLSTVVAAATVLTPSITAAAPTATLVSATITTALGTAALGSTALGATAVSGTFASTKLAAGATTAAKLAAQEVAAMSIASKATMMFVTTAASTTVVTGLVLGAMVGSFSGGKGTSPPPSNSSLAELAYPLNIVSEESAPNPFALEHEEPTLLAMGEPEKKEESQELLSTKPEAAGESGELSIVYVVADLNAENQLLARQFAETLVDTVHQHGPTQSLVIRVTSANHKKISAHFDQLRKQQEITLGLIDDLTKAQAELDAKLKQVSHDHVEAKEIQARIATTQKSIAAISLASLLQHEKDRNTRVLNERIAGQQQIIDDLQKHSEELQKPSDDTSDGTVTHVDSPRNTVWLDIGRKDHLRTQVTFSVSGMNHQGLTNDTKAVKAKIEVVELSETSSIARIVEEDRENPIEKGDVIFSPVWSAGLKEHFAFVGNGDLNGDGQMNNRDRQILHELIENAGGEISLEVTDEGVRVPADAKLTLHTKWLVVGDQADSPKEANNPVAIGHLLAIQQQREALVQEARIHGIKIVSLKDFLTYLGWNPESRLYVGKGLKRMTRTRAVITPTPGEAVRITDPDTTVELPLRTKTEFTFPERIATVDGFETNILSVESLTPQSLHITRVARGDNEVVVTGESKAKYRIHVLLQERSDLGSSAPAASKDEHPSATPADTLVPALSKVDEQSLQLRQPGESISLRITVFEADEQTIAELATKSEHEKNTLLPVAGIQKQFKAFRDAGRIRVFFDQTSQARMGETGEFFSGGEIEIPNLKGGSEPQFLQFGTRWELTPHERSENEDLLLEYMVQFTNIDKTQAVEFEGKKIPGLKTWMQRSNITLPADRHGALSGPWPRDSTPTKDGKGVAPNLTYTWIQQDRDEPAWETCGLRLSEIPYDSELFRGTKFRGGMLIREVRPASPAENQGIKPGDILVGLNEWETLNLANISHAIHLMKMKMETMKMARLKFYLVRDGQTRNGHMTIEDKKRSTKEAPKSPDPQVDSTSLPEGATAKLPASALPRDEKEQKSLDALTRPMSFEFEAIPLMQFLTALDDEYGIAVAVDSPEENRFDDSIRVSISSNGCTLSQILKALALAIHPEARFIEKNNTLLLTQVNKSDVTDSTVAYDLSKSTKTAAEAEEFIRTFLNPHADPKFQMTRIENILVMKATPYGHLQLNDFLTQQADTEGDPLPKPVIRVTREEKGANEIPEAKTSP